MPPLFLTTVLFKNFWREPWLWRGCGKYYATRTQGCSVKGIWTQRIVIGTTHNQQSDASSAIRACRCDFECTISKHNILRENYNRLQKEIDSSRYNAKDTMHQSSIVKRREKLKVLKFSFFYCRLVYSRITCQFEVVLMPFPWNKSSLLEFFLRLPVNLIVHPPFIVS